MVIPILLLVKPTSGISRGSILPDGIPIQSNVSLNNMFVALPISTKIRRTVQLFIFNVTTKEVSSPSSLSHFLLLRAELLLMILITLASPVYP